MQRKILLVFAVSLAAIAWFAAGYYTGRAEVTEMKAQGCAWRCQIAI